MRSSFVAFASASVLAVVTLHARGEQRPAAKTFPPVAKAVATTRSVPFKPGETLGYDVSWSAYLTAGYATLNVREQRPSYGSTAYYIVAEGRPTPLLAKLYTLYYKVDTLLDVYTLLPQRGSTYSDEGGHHRTRVVQFHQDARKADYEVRTATIVKNQLSLPPFTQDALSAVYVLRAIPLQQGSKPLTMPVCDNGELYKVQFTVEGRDVVKTGIGTIPGWRIKIGVASDEAIAHARGLVIWLSDDARRLPLQMRAELPVGTFNLVLRDAR